MLELRAHPRLSTHILGLPFSAPVPMDSTDAQSSICQAGAPHTGCPWQRRGYEHAPQGQRTSLGRPSGEALPLKCRRGIQTDASVPILLSLPQHVSALSITEVSLDNVAVAGKGGPLVPRSVVISGRSGEGEPASVLLDGSQAISVPAGVPWGFSSGARPLFAAEIVFLSGSQPFVFVLINVLVSFQTSVVLRTRPQSVAAAMGVCHLHP